MESKIIKEKRNPFLDRTEILLEIKGEVAPTFEDVRSAIKGDAELIVIKRINTNFGKHTFTAEAVVYDSVEAKEKIETIPKKIRKKMEEEKRATEAAKKAKPEEAVSTESAVDDEGEPSKEPEGESSEENPEKSESKEEGEKA